MTRRLRERGRREEAEPGENSDHCEAVVPRGRSSLAEAETVSGL